VDETFQLEVASDHDFDIGIYEAGSDDTNRKTLRLKVQVDTSLTASMAIGSTSDYNLELDFDNDGVFDKALNAQVTTLDVVKPYVTELYPEPMTTISDEDVSVFARYADNPGGTGIDLQANKIFVDGIDLTSDTFMGPEILSLTLSDIEPGEHYIRLVVSDLDGNATVTEWAFTIQSEFSNSLDAANPIFVNGIGVFVILLIGSVLAFSFRRKQRQAKLQHPQQKFQGEGQAETVQDQQGNWWYQDPDTGIWQIWNGQSWQIAQVEPVFPPAPPSRTFAAEPKGKGCLPSIIVVCIMSALVIGGFTLVAFGFFPALTIPPASSVSINELLKIGGGGLLLTLLGTLLLRGGFKSIATRRVIVEDELGRRREKRGCLAILNGFGQMLIGLILLIAGLGLVALALYQQLLPLLGYSLV